MFSVRTSENSYCDLLSFISITLVSWNSWLTSKLSSLDQDLLDFRSTVLTSDDWQFFCCAVTGITVLSISSDWSQRCCDWLSYASCD